MNYLVHLSIQFIPFYYFVLLFRRKDSTRILVTASDSGGQPRAMSNGNRIRIWRENQSKCKIALICEKSENVNKMFFLQNVKKEKERETHTERKHQWLTSRSIEETFELNIATIWIYFGI